MFIDEAFILVRSGAGGKGCISFRRENYVPRGGPEGGDGGKGGNVILLADPQLATLVDVSRRSVYEAEKGRGGSGANRTGRQGGDLVLAVPAGTMVREVLPGRDPRQGPILADLSRPGQRLLVARGGKGGRGNRAFATPVIQAPRIAEEGGPAEEKKLYLELKLLADVGLVGLPNAGKSTLLSRISAATPKIAAYPFTTLHPNLGLAEIGGWNRLVFADIPGLIEGAHLGRGLGTEFLRHLERTKALAHLISVEEPELEALEKKFRIIETELASFNEALSRKPRLVVLSKCDLLPEAEAERLVERFREATGVPVFGLSAVTGMGIEEFLHAMEAMVKERRPTISPSITARRPLLPSFRRKKRPG
ncbi:MAG: GTPase ObgE [Planctomycetes bacterium]|nr:GTPase ObgE [Planctomycetota bacterium]